MFKYRTTKLNFRHPSLVQAAPVEFAIKPAGAVTLGCCGMACDEIADNIEEAAN
jgi:hypothetical protein